MSRVLARIDAIRDQLGIPASGQGFHQMLDAHVEAPVSSSTAFVPSSSGGFASLGTMLSSTGAIIPVAASPSLPTAVVRSGQLVEYLDAHEIRPRNGHLAAEDLQEVGGGWDGPVRLLPPAAEAWESMRSAARADGVELVAIDSYRNWDVQAHAHEEYKAGRKDAYVRPPGASEHGVGLAVDVTNGSLVAPGDREWEWLAANAHRYGWHPISNESWHWEFRGTD